MTIIDAKTGRRMQTSASFCTYRTPGAVIAPASLDDRHGLAADEISWLDDDGLTGGEALEDLDALLFLPARRHALLDRAAVLHAEHLLDTGEDDDRRRGHEDRRLIGPHHDLGLGERARAQYRALVRHLGLDRQRSVLLLDRRGQPDDAAAVDGRITLDRYPDLLAHAHAGGGALGNGQRESDGVDADERGHGSPRHQVFADGGPALADDPVGGRREHAVDEGLARHLQLRPSLGQHRLAIARFLDRVV